MSTSDLGGKDSTSSTTSTSKKNKNKVKIDDFSGSKENAQIGAQFENTQKLTKLFVIGSLVVKCICVLLIMCIATTMVFVITEIHELKPFKDVMNFKDQALLWIALLILFLNLFVPVMLFYSINIIHLRRNVMQYKVYFKVLEAGILASFICVLGCALCWLFLLSFQPESFTENMRLAIDKSFNNHPSSMHKLQQKFRCCGVAVSMDEESESTNEGKKTHQWYSWDKFNHEANFYRNLTSENVMSLPWSCCNLNRQGCRHFRVSDILGKKNESLPEIVQHGDQGMDSDAIKAYSKGIYTRDCSVKFAESLTSFHGRIAIAFVLIGICLILMFTYLFYLKSQATAVRTGR